LLQLQPATLMKILKLKEPVDEPNPFSAQIRAWKNNELHVSVDCGRDARSAVIAWDLSTHKWPVVSREAPAKGQQESINGNTASLSIALRWKLEARGVEPLSSSLSAQTSTRLSGDKF